MEVRKQHDESETTPSLTAKALVNQAAKKGSGLGGVETDRADDEDETGDVTENELKQAASTQGENQSNKTELSVVTTKQLMKWEARVPSSKEELETMLKQLDNDAYLEIPDRPYPKLAPVTLKRLAK